MSSENKKTKQQIIAGNWKMHKTSKEVETFFRELKSLPKANQRRILAVSPTLLEKANQLGNTKNIEIFSQNCFGESQGAFTGEISPLQLKEIGIHGSLVGHSERRQYFGETDETCVKRTLGLWSHDIEVIYCIGEKLEDRKSEATSKILTQQLESLIGHYQKKLSEKSFAKLIIAYEPVWAIGTGLTADSKQITEAHSYIHDEFIKSAIPEAAVPLILYGGSVKTNNFGEINKLPYVNGGLVGGASLKASDFDLLCETYAL